MLKLLYWIVDFFRVSEKELKAEIFETEDSLAKSRTRLEDLRKERRILEKNRKKQGLKIKRFFKSYGKNLFLAMVLLFCIVALGYIGISQYKDYKNSFHYECDYSTMRECDDCVVLGCLKFDEVTSLEKNDNSDTVWFTVLNNKEQIGDCYMNVTIIEEDVQIYNKIFYIDEIKPKESLESFVELEFACSEIESEILFDAYCIEK